MEIGEEEEAFRLILHSYPAQDRAEQIAEVKVAGRLDAGYDAHWLAAHSTAFFLPSAAMASRSIPPITQATAK
jgi:hypothetical protein